MSQEVAIYPREWETVEEGCLRLKVPGGWLVQIFDYTDNGGMSSAMCFLPDLMQRWDLEPDK